MPPHHKKNKHCSQCGHCRTWRVNRAFVRATKTNGVVMKHFKTCNRCSRLYRKTGPLTKADFREKYGGSDHVEYATHKRLTLNKMFEDRMTY